MSNSIYYVTFLISAAYTISSTTTVTRSSTTTHTNPSTTTVTRPSATVYTTKPSTSTVTRQWTTTYTNPSTTTITRPWTTTTKYPSTTARTITPSSTYSGVLSSASPRFTRINGDADKSYFYQAIQVTVSTYATYTFSSISSLDTFGSFYNYPFEPVTPSHNLITSDDDSGGNRQFRINATLQNERTYILVVTTYDANVTGSFSVIAAGPGSISLTTIMPPTSKCMRIYFWHSIGNKLLHWLAKFIYWIFHS